MQRTFQKMAPLPRSRTSYANSGHHTGKFLSKKSSSRPTTGKRKTLFGDLYMSVR